MAKVDKRFFITELAAKVKKFEPIPAWTPKEAKRLLFLDNDVLPGAFYMSVSWFWPGDWPPLKPGAEPRVKPHTHDFDEIIGFVGTNPDDINDLCGEVELWIDGKQNILNKSFMAFVPAGVMHCPLNILRAERPIFHFNCAPSQNWVAQTPEGITKKK
jgi:hypothetical protein